MPIKLWGLNMSFSKVWPVIAMPFCATFAHSIDSNAYVTQLDKIVVTSTREEKSKADLSESIGVLTAQEIQNVSPSHPSEILNRTPGVYINNLGGEGHMTAIRQPITTSGVYLFLEDGVPTRPTGFFNHNGLYEVNIPQSERIEVTKGPGSALYGSDAIGGVINSISAKIPDNAQSKIDTEVGGDGWQRVLLSAGAPINAYSGVAISANVTHNDGFRDDAEYDRGSLNTRFNYKLSSNVEAKNTISFTKVDQSGVSSLEEDDYNENVTTNFFKGDVGARDIEALRVTSEINFLSGKNSLITMTPFYRHNESNMMPSWMVTYDANYRETQFESFGLLSKYRLNLANNSVIIVGTDIDHTPSSYQEFAVDVTKEGDFYTGYTTTGELNYDYDADQTSISPYLQYENKITDQVLVNAGVRYDLFKVNYDNNLSVTQEGKHLRVESQNVEYDHVSPKAGVVYKYGQTHDVYANYRHGFRAPSVGTLFRSGSSLDTPDLKPVKTDSVEIGFRGLAYNQLSYELAVYYMEKTDDIVSVITSDSERVSLNAGETKHSGIELGLGSAISQTLSFNSSFSYSEQTYGDFAYLYQCFTCEVRNQLLNFDGNDVGKAPNTLGNISLRYESLKQHSFMFEIEVEHVGSYYTDETNTSDYDGHDLVNLRSRFRVSQDVELYARIKNLTDKRYSTYTSNQVGKDVGYRPGQPLTAFAGIRASF